MNDLSRVHNSKKNLLNGFINQFIMLLLTFVSRSIFIYYLGVEYLGINGLYSNILQLLSLTDLGISNIALFSLYKPIAEKDEDKICGLICYYKKIYRNIFFIILIIGLCLIPFLPSIIDSTLNINDLIGYYILFLLNTALSYAFVYNRIFINADQRIYIIKNTTTFVTIVQNIFQILVMVIWRNYYLYLIVQCLGTLFINLILTYQAIKHYPFLKKRSTIPKEEQKGILKSTSDLFIYKVGGMIVHSTDNIIISVLLGTIFVGYYSNYYMIVTVIINFVNVLINSITASIGNLGTEGNIDHQYKIFKHLIFIFQWIISFASIGMLVLFNDFILIWLGDSYLLSESVVAVIVMNFYIQFIISPIWIYRENLGFYKEVKYLMIVTAFINIVLSIILGKFMGMMGIFLATILARLFTVVWYEPIILMKKHFKKSVKNYYFLQIKYFLFFVFVYLITNFLCSFISVNGYLTWILKACLLTLIVNFMYFIFFRKTDTFIFLKNKILRRNK